MSFLDDVRLVFAGRFQADMSTVNNDVRHFDNASFDPSFQQFQGPSGTPMNGWWNPTGSGAFRLLGCRVTAAHAGDGSAATTASDDAAVGMSIAGSDDRSSGKLVDVDPQWQMASAPWGLEVRLADRAQPAYLSGPFKAHAFRDLWFGRLLGSSGGDGGATAIFQSILQGVRWAPHLKGSRALEALRERSAATGALSIRLMTYGYRGTKGQPDFTMGRVVGVIGPHLEGEPESFVLGRRFAPANGSTTWAGCSFFSAAVGRGADRLFLDLSNATPLIAGETGIGVNDIGPIGVGVLRDPSTAEGTPVGAASMLQIGRVEGYAEPGWLERTGGVVALPLAPEAAALLADRPLALTASSIANGATGPDGEYGDVAIRETPDGLLVEAEPAVCRIDAPGDASVTLRAARYGAPVAADLALRQCGRIPNQGGGQTTGPGTPTAPIPDIGFPAEALRFPETVATDADGRAAVTLSAVDPGKPRSYIDGQIYLVDFRLPGQSNAARNPFDYVIVHVRDAVAPQLNPTWSDVEPILVQYGNLYPIMSQGLFDISKESTVRVHARTMHLAFSMPMDDPNHMPVTRDLSDGKRAMILAYLERAMGDHDPAVQIAVAADPVATARPVTRPHPIDNAIDGKTTAARAFTSRLNRATPA